MSEREREEIGPRILPPDEARPEQKVLRAEIRDYFFHKGYYGSRLGITVSCESSGAVFDEFVTLAAQYTAAAVERAYRDGIEAVVKIVRAHCWMPAVHSYVENDAYRILKQIEALFPTQSKDSLNAPAPNQEAMETAAPDFDAADQELHRMIPDGWSHSVNESQSPLPKFWFARISCGDRDFSARSYSSPIVALALAANAAAVEWEREACAQIIRGGNGPLVRIRRSALR